MKTFDKALGTLNLHWKLFIMSEELDGFIGNSDLLVHLRYSLRPTA